MTLIEFKNALLVFIFLLGGIEIFKLKKNKQVFDPQEVRVSVIIIFLNFFAAYLLAVFTFHLGLRNFNEPYYQMLKGIIPFYRLEPGSFFYYLVSFLIADLFYYLTHVLNHKVNFLWASHYCHHTIRKFTILNGCRNFLRPLVLNVYIFFYALPIVFGIQLRDVIGILAIISLYNVILHNIHVPRLKVIEYFLNTPSLHRVHHQAQNIDRPLQYNFGGLLSIWDHLFRTFKPEEDFITTFGIPGKESPKNSFKALFEGWENFGKQVLKAKTPKALFESILWKL